MPIIETGFTQLSEEWFKARLGSVGASSMDKIVTSDGSPSKQRDGYMLELAAEKIRGKSDDTFKSAAMENGITKEDEARDFFQLIYDLKVEQVGIVYKDERKLCHCSPDGLIGLEEGIEIKCPLAKTQAKYLLDKRLPTEYSTQVQSSLYITERKHWWFMSYCDSMRPLIIKVNRDEMFIKKLEIELEKFFKELNEIIEKIR